MGQNKISPILSRFNERLKAVSLGVARNGAKKKPGNYRGKKEGLLDEAPPPQGTQPAFGSPELSGGTI